jgi:photosystem II stability/assembly factor-like uncharacterized protein
VVDERAAEDTVFALAASPEFARDRTVFVARTSGLYRSLDGGATWQAAYASLQLRTDLLTSTVAVSPDFGRDRTVIAGCSGGVVCSYDAGATWRVVMLPSPPSLVSCVIFSPHYADDGVAFLATLEDGVYRSADRGQTWVRWNFGLFDLRVIGLAPSPAFARDETLYAGAETGIYVSRNGGRSWRPLPFPDEAAPVLSLAVAPGSGTDVVVWAGTETAGLWLSEDAGRSWRRTEEALFRESVNALVVPHPPAGETSILALATEGIFVLRRGRWARFADQLADEELTAVAAPMGLDGALLVGLSDGRVVCAER